MRSLADVYSLHCNPTTQTDTLFSYKLDFEHSKGQVIGSPSYFLKRRYNPIEKTQVKKGLLLILWILMKKGIWFLDIADCGAPFRACVVPRGEFTCSFEVCKAANRRQTWFDRTEICSFETRISLGISTLERRLSRWELCFYYYYRELLLIVRYLAQTDHNLYRDYTPLLINKRSEQTTT